MNAYFYKISNIYNYESKIFLVQFDFLLWIYLDKINIPDSLGYLALTENREGRNDKFFCLTFDKKICSKIDIKLTKEPLEN